MNYQKLYYALFAASVDLAEAMEKGDSDQIKTILLAAEQKAEKMDIETVKAKLKNAKETLIKYGA